MRGDLFRQTAESDYVFEEAAEIGMVHDFGGWGALEAFGGRGVGEYAESEFLQPGIADGISEVEELGPEFADVFLGVREVVGEIDFVGFGDADLRKRKLRTVAVDFDASLDFYEVVAADVFGWGFEEIPHARFDGAAAIAEREAEVGAAFAGVADFFFVDKEETGDGLFAGEIGDEVGFHGLVLGRIAESGGG